jgi:hypothetical protein
MRTRTTNAARAPSTPSALTALAKRLNHWRLNRRRGQRIPEELWEAAASLAGVHGLCPTAAALKLNYYDLQRRLGPSRKAKAAYPPPTLIAMPGLLPAQPDPGTVEVVHANGSRLLLRLSNPRSRDLLPLVAAFLRS